MDLLNNDRTGQVFELFDEEGMELFNRTDNWKKSDIISYTIVYSNYKDELFKNENYMSAFFKCDISNFYAILKGLKDETYELILKSCTSNLSTLDHLDELISYFSKDYKLKLVQNWPYSMDHLYKLINSLGYFEIDILDTILTKYNIDLSSPKINLQNLVSIIKENNDKAFEFKNSSFKNDDYHDYLLPPNLITNSLASRIWQNYDIFKARKMLNELVYICDPSTIHEYFKKKEDSIINHVSSNKLLDNFEELWNSFKEFKECDDDTFIEKRKNYVNIARGFDTFVIENMETLYVNNKQEAYEFLKKCSDNCISNYIIDYHFEENYHNIMIDINELLNFYYSGNISLPMEKVGIYDRIRNIDLLSTEEKLELHNELKTMNVKEMFYDDMAYSREVVGELLKEQTLNKESIQEYRDEELSKKYGVDVYVIEDNPFFALVKTGRKFDDFPTGHSFSMVGGGVIGVFGSVESSNTFVYDTSNLNPKQLVHVYPFDSYTLYKPFELSFNASDYVNRLATPEELTKETSSVGSNMYNEILILERGLKNTDLDLSIPELNKLALYCMDNISEKDVEVAKSQGVGLFLVNSNNYDKGMDLPFSSYNHYIYENRKYYSDLDINEFNKERV